MGVVAELPPCSMSTASKLGTARRWSGSSPRPRAPLSARPRPCLAPDKPLAVAPDGWRGPAPLDMVGGPRMRPDRAPALTTLSPSSDVSSSMGLSAKWVCVMISCACPPTHMRRRVSHTHRRMPPRPQVETHVYTHQLLAGVGELLQHNALDHHVRCSAILHPTIHQRVKHHNRHADHGVLQLPHALLVASDECRCVALRDKPGKQHRA